MQVVDFQVRSELIPYVNCIMFDECDQHDHLTRIPIYADGYPGIMFQQSENGFQLLPKGKELSRFFLYGQTIAPIILESHGQVKFVVFQLYPFASKYLLGVDPRELNDDCYDLLSIENIDIKKYVEDLSNTANIEEQINIISQVMVDLIKCHEISHHDEIQNAIHLILKSEGNLKIKHVLSEIPMSERSFERNFKAQVGLNPKQFAKIIQFQKSLSKLQSSESRSLTEVGLESGFADQSHFIRTFKSYTGQTPSYYLKQL